MWITYELGFPVKVQADVDWNGVPDVTTEYAHGIPTKALWHPNGGGTVRIEHFTHGVKTHEQVDTNSDGTLDTARHFDPFGNEVPRPIDGP